MTIAHQSRFKARIEECHATYLAVLRQGERLDIEFSPREARAVIHGWTFEYQHVVSNYEAGDDTAPISSWLDHECEGDFIILPNKDGEDVKRIIFEQETDAVLFRLRFGGKLHK